MDTMIIGIAGGTGSQDHPDAFEHGLYHDNY